MELLWQSDPQLVDWNELAELYRRAPLGIRNPDDLRIAFTNSLYCAFLYHDGKLIGAGRALCDGVYCAMLCDIALLPDYHGLGLGRQLMERLMALCAQRHGKIILYAMPERIPFYRKLGFRKMKTAMAQFLNQPKQLEEIMLEDEEV